jgi:peptidoglycan glycosyltransferase
MGETLGYNGLKKIFSLFYFNSQPFKDGFLTFNTGKMPGSAATGYDLAHMSVGLEKMKMTTFHAAFMAQIITQSGTVYPPYMIINKKNLLNIGYYAHKAEPLTVLKDNSSFAKVKNAMVYVVESPDGTGRRARVDDLPIGMKTGTAGNRQVGLDAVIVGFFPADKPKYAFAFRLQRVGKAEWIGAQFLKRFLEAFRR